MPTTFILCVTPRSPLAPHTWAGQALHATFLSWCKQLDPGLAARLHDQRENKSYVLSDLLPDPSPSEAAGLIWRWSALDASTREAMLAILADCPPAMTILGVPCRVSWAPTHPLAQHLDYADLLEWGAEPGPLPALHFESPTSFKVHDHDHPFPLPRLIVQSCLARWNTYAAQPLPTELVAQAELWLYVVDMAVRTSVVEAGKKCVSGFRGHVTFGFDERAPGDFRVAVRALLAYAAFCGVGRKTTMGLGQVLLKNGAIEMPAQEPPAVVWNLAPAVVLPAPPPLVRI